VASEPANGIPGRRLLIGMVVILAAAVIPGVFLPTLACKAADPKLDDFGPLPAFALTDERGQPFTQDALHGSVTIVSFIFTRCDSICPMTTMKMQGIQEKSFDVADKVKLLSISIDPKYDTPARLAAYATQYHADPARWRFVTGSYDAIHGLVETGFLQNMQLDGTTAGGAPNIAHSGYFALVDTHGHMRASAGANDQPSAAYDSREDQRLDQLIRDARFLARTGN
jgi:protein SCO1/2